MIRSNDSDWLRVSRSLLIGGFLLAIVPTTARAQSDDPGRSTERGELEMPRPHVRKRVPARRSRTTSMEADRARQALMHSQPQPHKHYVPKHERFVNAEMQIEPISQAAPIMQGGEVVGEPVYLQDGDIPHAPSYAEGNYADDAYYDDGYADDEWSDGCDCGQCGDAGCSDDCGCGFDCGGECGGTYGDMSGYPFGALWGMGNLEAFVGGLGFVGPFNQGNSGSFGFQEGFNFGTVLPVFPYSGWGWQIGTRSTQSNLSGASFTTNERQQTFFTTGVFKRACAGWQGGLVADVLQDNWFAEANVTQLRGELSFRCPCVHEFGYRFSVALRDDQVVSPLDNTQTNTYESYDLHSLFYRRRLTWAPGAQATVFAGVSGVNNGYLGADFQMPLSDFFAIRSSLAYVIPESNITDGSQEAWNMSISLVFNLRGSRPGGQQSKFTPLLDVADNGNFILNQISP